jgi:putative transposase
MTKQRAFTFRTWGGARKGAGRPPREAQPGVSHLRRPLLKSRFPVHATWRMRGDVWNLRARRCLRVLQRAFRRGSKDDFQIVHYSVMGNHIHLLVEASDRRALALGMQGLGIRIARGLQAVMGRRGHVIKERYHARILETPTEVKRVRLYLLDNARRHYGLLVPDWCASQTPVHAPRTYLLRQLR